jgi:hypothetical protein
MLEQCFSAGINKKLLSKGHVKGIGGDKVQLEVLEIVGVAVDKHLTQLNDTHVCVW